MGFGHVGRKSRGGPWERGDWMDMRSQGTELLKQCLIEREAKRDDVSGGEEEQGRVDNRREIVLT